MLLGSRRFEGGKAARHITADETIQQKMVDDILLCVYLYIHIYIYIYI